MAQDPSEIEFQSNPMPSKADAYKAVLSAKGNITEAARACGVPRGKFKSFIDAVPEIVALYSDLRDGVVDRAEQNIFNDVEKGDSAASRLVAQTLGKDRGWNQSVAGTGKDGAIIVEIRQFSEEAPVTNG